MIKELEEALKDKQIRIINGFYVVTDKSSYKEPDQVFPLHPENQFFLDEIVKDKMSGAKVLEIGTGSGVLSIAAKRSGADRVISLEINPRARHYAGFNIVANGLENEIEVRDGDEEEIFRPVQGETFDYVISNPPFEPTPPGADYYLHSSAGIYGLDFVKQIMKDIDQYLSEDGHAQIVAFAPGNEKNPFMLIDLVEKHLHGKTMINVEPSPLRYDEFVGRFVDIGQASQEQVDMMKQQAMEKGVSHLYLCMVHYEKGDKSLSIQASGMHYPNWDLPLNSDHPMGV